MTLKDKFTSKMSKPNENGCIEWTGALRGGYGALTICDKNSKYKYNKVFYAHRISYELFIGEINDGLFVCHTCDNRLCVNPNHLFLGTRKDNADDMMRKGRSNMKHGENHFGSKLKASDIKDIFNLSKNTPQRTIAKLFNVSQGAVAHILHKRTWIKESLGLER